MKRITAAMLLQAASKFSLVTAQEFREQDERTVDNELAFHDNLEEMNRAEPEDPDKMSNAIHYLMNELGGGEPVPGSDEYDKEEYLLKQELIGKLQDVHKFLSDPGGASLFQPGGTKTISLDGLMS